MLEEKILSDQQVLIPVEQIEQTILLIRGHRVMLDSDLARLYGVSTKALNQAVKRNRERFPPDFMFVLTQMEKNELVTVCDRFATLKHSTSLPHTFTEHGAVMLANVLRSHRAIQASIAVVRAFIHLRDLLGTHKKLALKLQEHDKHLGAHDSAIRSLFQTIRRLEEGEVRKRSRRIGFKIITQGPE